MLALCLTRRRAVLLKVGAEQSAPNPPVGLRTKAARPFGCKARQVRLTPARVGSFRVATLGIGPAKTWPGVPRKSRPANSSTMNGAQSPCGSAGSETVPNRETASGRVRGSFCILSPEIEAAGFGNYGGAGASPIPNAGWAINGPTNVTDPAKCSDNRGRNPAAGLVAGA